MSKASLLRSLSKLCRVSNTGKASLVAGPFFLALTNRCSSHACTLINRASLWRNRLTKFPYNVGSYPPITQVFRSQIESPRELLICFDRPSQRHLYIVPSATFGVFATSTHYILWPRWRNTMGVKKTLLSAARRAEAIAILLTGIRIKQKTNSIFANALTSLLGHTTRGPFGMQFGLRWQAGSSI